MGAFAVGKRLDAHARWSQGRRLLRRWNKEFAALLWPDGFLLMSEGPPKATAANSLFHLRFGGCATPAASTTGSRIQAHLAAGEPRQGSRTSYLSCPKRHSSPARPSCRGR